METQVFKITDPEKDKEAIRAVAAMLRAGETAAIPTETVYGLAANALDPAAVKRIFEAKGRPQDNPLIVHIAETADLDAVAASVPPKARLLAEAFWPGPLTVILPRGERIPPEVSAGLDTVAVRLPAHPVARAVIKAAGLPLAAPSANISGFPSPTSAQYVSDDMSGRVAAIVDGGDCAVGIESTVISLTGDVPRILRPGAVTPEQIEAVIGAVEIDPAVLQPLKAGETAASPGMKYKHYAPKAKLTVVPGTLKTFVSFVLRHTGEADHCLCFEEEDRFLPLPCVTYGRAEEPLSQTRRFFDALRELDADGANLVFARAPLARGVGLGICNRLYRAAGFSLRTDPPETAGLILGLCGGSGSGKSTVSALLAEKGAEVVDTDRIGRSLLTTGSPVTAALAEAFGKDILLPDGSPDRALLAKRAFADRKNADTLNAITHPAILRETVRRAFAASDAGTLAVIDAPLLFSSGLYRLCDLTALVDAPEETRRERIKTRDGLSDEAIDARFEAQREELALAERADLRLDNSPPHTPEEAARRLTLALDKKKEEERKKKG